MNTYCVTCGTIYTIVRAQTQPEALEKYFGAVPPLGGVISIRTLNKYEEAQIGIGN